MEFVKSKKEKRIWLISFLVLAAIAVLIAVILSRNQEGYRTIKVSEVSGKVGVVNNGIEYEAYSGMILKEGYAIVTSSDSYVRMVLDGDKYIKLEGGSRIVFEKLGILGSGKTTINLERGTITNEIVYPLGEDEDYIINTPNAVLAVRGTFFKVELKVTEEGDTTTDVLTYGGVVSSQRIKPDGNLIEEEVLIDSGYMTTVKMSSEETIYVVESTEPERENTTPIIKETIPDEDLIDIYFASENGHEMFITKEEIEEEINEREIDIEEHTSVYEKAESLEKENAITSPDDGAPIVREEETEIIVQGPSVPSDGGHTHKKTESIVEATCTTEGSVTISCSTCGEILSERVLSAKGHKEITDVVDATCTTAGKTMVSCQVCGELLSETEIAATGHVDGTPVITKNATCTEDGMKTVGCTECGLELSQEVIPKIGHKETTVVVDATCTTAGKTTISCQNCGELISETEIPATGHIHEIDGGTKNSHIECADCGAVLSTAHSYTDTVTKQPTCTDVGETTHTCACGYSYTTQIEALGHTEVNVGTESVHTKCETCGTVLRVSHTYTDTVIAEATCTDYGKMEHVCDCGYSYTTEIAATGHTEVNGGTENVHTKCETCGDVLSTTHSYTDTVTSEATCTDVGETTHSCACGYSYTTEIAATGHTEVNGGTENVHTKCETCGDVLSTTHSYTDTVTSEATCTDYGKMEHVCDCGYSYITEIAATGHTEVNGGTENVHTKCETCGDVLSTTHSYTDTVTSEATCTDVGETTHSCACGYSYTTEIAATGHTEVNGGTETSHTECETCGTVLSTAHSYTDTVTKQPTCTDEGETTHTCDCGYSYTTEIEATGHTEVNGGTETSHTECETCGTVLSTTHSYTDTVTKQPTCTDVGETTHTCACGYSYITEIAATGHTEVNGGTENSHTKCETCGTVLSTTHSYTDTVTKQPTCTDEGETTHTCDCGYSYTTEIAATGHTEVNGGTENSHTKCETCGTVLSTTHTYTDSVTKEATCTDTGETTHTCDCGYSYTSEIEATGHTEGVGGTATSHTQCQICSTVLSATHTYTDTVVTEATCTTTGKIKHACDCGWSYTETTDATGHTEGTPTVITAATCETDGQAEVLCVDCGEFIRYETLAATGHTKSDENASQTTCSTCGETMVDFNSTNFPDTGFYNSLKNDGVDENSDGILTGTELSKVHTIDFENVGIADATGLEHFTALQYLNLYDNAVSNVPCENLTALTYINLSNTSITSFDATKYPNLTSLYLSSTQISSLDLSNNPNLTTLHLTDCSNLTALDLSNNMALQTAELQFSGLTSFTLDGNTSITDLNLRCNALETISVTNCTSLTTLTMPNEHSCVVNSVDITGCTSLTSIDLNYVASTLQTFIADSSGLSGVMEFTSFQVLETVSLNNCASLIGLHMGYSSTLTTLNASNSGLAFVNLSGGDSITTLNVTNNRYIVETQNLYVDMSGVNYFYGDSIVQDSLSDGTFSDTSFSFYSTSDGSAISEITYTYDMGNGVTADFTVEIVSY